MSGSIDVWRRAAVAAGDGTAAALATVCRRRGSLPMGSDAKMLVTADGSRWGTVGGGCVEAEVIGQALAALERGAPEVVRHTLNADVAGDLGLSCGGTVELFLEPVVTGSAAQGLYAGVADWIDRRETTVVYTALDWSSGARKLAVARDRLAIGGWQGEPPVSKAGERLDEASGVFVEPIPRVPRLLIFGAGHVGQEIARAAAGTDFQTIVIDDREEFANVSRFPDAHDVLVRDHRATLDSLSIDEDDYIVVCTRGHAMDAVIVERTAGSAARYVGMLGSRRKQKVIWKALQEAGLPRAALERVKVPIGEEIGADTPGEIGISVLAELIRIRRLGA